MEGSDQPLYAIGSILVSGDHLIFDDVSRQWIPVSKHADAVAVEKRSTTLICLRTTSREIRVKSYRFRDWEELPDGYDTQWEVIVNMILNKDAKILSVPLTYPMIGASCEILHATGERRPISSIRIGDRIFGESGATRVTGIYKGTLIPEDSFTDGVWIKKERWEHMKMAPSGQLKPGYHLTTESGTFWIVTKDFSGFVRDFTEVGVERISLTYPFVEAVLKKSVSEEEKHASRIPHHGTCHPIVGEHLNALLQTRCSGPE